MLRLSHLMTCSLQVLGLTQFWAILWAAPHCFLWRPYIMRPCRRYFQSCYRSSFNSGLWSVDSCLYVYVSCFVSSLLHWIMIDLESPTFIHDNKLSGESIQMFAVVPEYLTSNACLFQTTLGHSYIYFYNVLRSGQDIGWDLYAQISKQKNKHIEKILIPIASSIALLFISQWFLPF